MALNIQQLLPKMLEAAKGILKDKWPDAQSYAKTEFTKIGQNIISIEELKLKGAITDEQAKILLDIQKDATTSVLAALEGIGKIIAEQAINAALGVIRDVVNTALGFVLI